MAHDRCCNTSTLVTLATDEGTVAHCSFIRPASARSSTRALAEPPRYSFDPTED